MRDSVTADDLAIESAKQRLVELAERDDYRVAIARVKKRELGPIVVCSTMCILATVGTIALGWIATGFMWIAVITLGVLALFMGMAWLGFAQEGPTAPFGVAVVGKEKDKNGIPELELLRADGERIRAVAAESLYGAVRPGDLGVAWIRKDSNVFVVTELERL